MSARRLTLRQTFHASSQAVFQAFVSGEALKEWWAPEGYVTIEAEVDARVGGRYRVVMRAHVGSDTVYVHGVYREISPPRKLVFTHTFERREREAPFARVGLAAHETLVTIEFVARGEMTELILLQEPIPTPDAEQMLRVGWRGILAHLGQHLARSSRT